MSDARKRTTKKQQVVKAALAASLSFLAVASLAGCSGTGIPQPEALKVNQNYPDIDDARLHKIATRLESSLEKADSSLDQNKLKGAFIGPAFGTRWAEYQLVKASQGTNQKVELTKLTLEPKLATVSIGTKFPRVAMAVTKTPDGGAIPALVTLVQTRAHNNFQLWGYATIFPNAQIPSINTLVVGAPDLKDGPALRLSPEDTLKKYAQVLAEPNGQDSQLFADDPLRVTINSLVANLSKGVKTVGKVEAQYSLPEKSSIYALRTAKGGALVMGVLDTKINIHLTQAGASLSLGDQIGNLIQFGTGSKDVKGEVSASYLSTLVFYVPPASESAAKVSLLGATSILSTVSRDDSKAPKEQPAGATPATPAH